MWCKNNNLIKMSGAAVVSLNCKSYKRQFTGHYVTQYGAIIEPFDRSMREGGVAESETR